MRLTAANMGASLLAISLVMSGCSGGDGPDSTPAPSPTPTPTGTGTPTPTPTPTPTSAAAKLGATANMTYKAASSSFTRAGRILPTPSPTPTPTGSPTPTPTPTPTSTGTPAPTPTPTPTPTPSPVPTPTGTPPAYGNQANEGFNGGTTIEYNYANDSYRFTRADGRTVSVGKGDLVTGARLGGDEPGDSPFFSSTKASVYTVSNAGKVTQTVATLPPGDYGAVKMSHMAVTFWDIYYGETGRHDQQWLVWGNQTQTMPTTGSASYKLDGGIGGNGFDSESGKYYQFLDGDSTGSLDVDFASGDINLLLHLIGAEAAAGGADKDFGSFTGAGAVASGTAQYGGTFTDGGTGKFDGAFFGPDAAETGFTFFVNTATTAVNGVAVGQKQP